MIEAEFIEEDIEILEDFPEKNMSARERRKKNITKAIRKRNISKAVGGITYSNLHQYSKNKIHCSCNLCRFRTSFNPDQKTYSDMKREASMNAEYKEYLAG